MKKKPISLKSRRTISELIAHLERSIRRFGDSDGKRTKLLISLKEAQDEAQE